jgi:hypothetical protein
MDSPLIGPPVNLTSLGKFSLVPVMLYDCHGYFARRAAVAGADAE